MGSVGLTLRRSIVLYSILREHYDCIKIFYDFNENLLFLGKRRVVKSEIGLKVGKKTFSRPRPPVYSIFNRY
jgi:hypothetical protein